MNELLALITLVGIAAVGTLAIVLFRRRPRKLNQEYFQRKWVDLQQLCGDKTTWKQAIIE
jgi:hypothetical protein